MKDMVKRKRVMQRSIRLGHCICNPALPCPCPLFKEKDICQCAGERLKVEEGPVKLTQLVEKAGCASKIDQAFLKQVLKGLPSSDDPRVMVGVPAGDDAGIYKLSDDMALVQTVDVFTPSVDDPYMFGQVAAANSLSDVYAMGGNAMTALSVLGFPARTVSDRAMHDILRGGLDKMSEAGVAVIGGHSINDPEIKAGFAVIGSIHPAKVVTNANAQPGDVLILTKPLGTGIITFAAQIGRTGPDGPAAAALSMTTLNKTASELMVKHGAHACTDVTGFSLMGHLSEMALSSNVDVEVVFDEMPLFPGVLEAAGNGILPGAIERNKESCLDRVAPGEGIEQTMIDICFDAQTSGGLLICISSDKANQLLSELHKEGIAAATIIGKVRGYGTGKVFLETAGKRKIPAESNKAEVMDNKNNSTKNTESCCGVSAPGTESCCAPPVSVNESCCPEPVPVTGSCCADQAASGDSRVSDQFSAFMQAVNRPGALDVSTKQSIAIALSVLSKCEPCLNNHILKAQEMGFSMEEIDEAAWMAISFGGSPIMMFYQEVKSKMSL
ncbi:MAG: selenide, water dikinase SelD [Planctomycetes bacterium]|nr:selenide, water dikinase SelD [Planctomycetota bacterium]